MTFIKHIHRVDNHPDHPLTDDGKAHGRPTWYHRVAGYEKELQKIKQKIIVHILYLFVARLWSMWKPLILWPISTTIICYSLISIGFAVNQAAKSNSFSSFKTSLNEGGQTDVIIIDFSNAFDKVDHERLLLKLNHTGINSSVINWIRVFLSNRSQLVVLDGDESDTWPVQSGSIRLCPRPLSILDLY